MYLSLRLNLNGTAIEANREIKVGTLLGVSAPVALFRRLLHASALRLRIRILQRMDDDAAAAAAAAASHHGAAAADVVVVVVVVVHAVQIGLFRRKHPQTGIWRSVSRQSQKRSRNYLKFELKFQNLKFRIQESNSYSKFEFKLMLELAQLFLLVN